MKTHTREYGTDDAYLLISVTANNAHNKQEVQQSVNDEVNGLWV